MPHLQAPEKGTAKEEEEQGMVSNASEEEKNALDPPDGNKLLSLATTASKHSPPAPQTDHPSDLSSNSEGFTAASSGQPERPQVTPSPYGNVAPRGFEQPPYYGYESHPPSWMGGPHSYDRGRVMGVYGNGGRRLFPSPIRYSRTKSEEENPEESKGVRRHPEELSGRPGGYPFRASPSHGRPLVYGAPNMHPYPGYPHRPHGSYDEQYSHHQPGDHVPPPHSPIKKRPQAVQNEETASASKRWKGTSEQPSSEKTKPKSEGSATPQEPVSTTTTAEEEVSKQRVISPTSSVECQNLSGKSQDDESTSCASDRRIKPSTSSSNEALTAQGPPRFSHHLPVQEARFAATPMTAPYQHHFYAPGYGYPPPPPPPRYGESQTPNAPGWRMPPSSSFPPAPPVPGPIPPYPSSYPPSYNHHHHLPHHHARYPPRGPQFSVDSASTPLPSVKKGLEAKKVTTSSATAPGQEQTENRNTETQEIKSVAEWQRATLATGKAPSANRCMQLKAPIPSKYWGEAEKAKDTQIPDFHALVNFPDYLNKMRPNGNEPPGSVPLNNGKRPCVMCGKLRICSASSANLGSNVLRRSKKQEDGDDDDADDVDSNHIIPRQNKGLCTACDVSVWVVVETGLEIKWCKGCKNFRPWAAFGDKGLATKCVRCRDRQREKYALQKDELRLRRLRQNSVKQEEKKDDDQQHEIAAAKGLRDLMAASVSLRDTDDAEATNGETASMV